MPIKLSTLLDKFQKLSLKENSEIISKSYTFMKSNNSSKRHVVNNLKVILNFDKFFHKHFLGLTNEHKRPIIPT